MELFSVLTQVHSSNMRVNNYEEKQFGTKICLFKTKRNDSEGVSMASHCYRPLSAYQNLSIWKFLIFEAGMVPIWVVVM